MESSIKCCKINLFKDLKSWEIDNNFRLARNKNLHIKVKTQLVSHKDFLIVMASEKLKSDQLVICDHE